MGGLPPLAPLPLASHPLASLLYISSNQKKGREREKKKEEEGEGGKAGGDDTGMGGYFTSA